VFINKNRGMKMDTIKNWTMKRKILVISLAVTILLILGSFITVNIVEGKMVKSNIELGIKKLSEGNFKEATLILEQTISIDENNKQAMDLLNLIKDYEIIEELYKSKEYRSTLELIGKIKSKEYFNYIENEITEINKDIDSKLQVMKEMDDLSDTVEKLIESEKFDEALSLINKYKDEDLTEEYKKKLNKILEELNKSKASYDEQKALKEKIVNLNKNLKRTNEVDGVYVQKRMVNSMNSDVSSELKQLSKEFGVNTRRVIFNDAYPNGNSVVYLYSEGKISDVKLYKIDFNKLDPATWDFKNYVRDFSNSMQFTNIIQEVKLDEAIAIRCQEPEGMPMHVISWVGKSSKPAYFLIHYDGQGTGSIVKDIYIP
jgi:tetratricopeptide (TPR) repeat protein